MTIELNVLQTTGLAMLLFVLGRFIVNHVGFLRRCCIPALDFRLHITPCVFSVPVYFGRPCSRAAFQVSSIAFPTSSGLFVPLSRSWILR